nr:MAG TPA: hypothetical protein [Caudoviricetes sp.]
MIVSALPPFIVIFWSRSFLTSQHLSSHLNLTGWSFPVMISKVSKLESLILLIFSYLTSSAVFMIHHFLTITEC